MAAGMERSLLESVAKKVAKPMKKGMRKVGRAATPGDDYWVENEGQRIGPYTKRKKAEATLKAETKQFKAAGGRSTGGKKPEMLYRPPGNTSKARFPDGKKIPRLSPRTAAEDDHWDYRTRQPMHANTIEQNLAGQAATRGKRQRPGPRR